MDLTKYTSIFIEESRDHLQSLNDKLLELESDHDAPGVLNEIFRSAHTLKGMSATMGFTNLAELTHQMENVLQKLRSAEVKVNSVIIDTLFKCLDQLEKMVEDIANGGEGNYQDSNILKLLDADILGKEEAPKTAEEDSPQSIDSPKDIISGEENVEFNEYESNLILEGNKNGFNTFHITVFIRASCIMKSARSYMIFKNLEQFGEIVKTLPSVQDIEDEKFDNSFEVILLSTEAADKIRQAIVSISEVDEPVIAQIEVQKVESLEEAKKQQEDKPKNEETIQPQIVCDDKKCEIVAKPKKVKASQTVRVDIEKLDSLMNLVGELVINKTRLEQISKHSPTPEMNEALEQTDRLTSDLQNIVMKVRMVPIDQVFSRFPRMIRDLAKDLNKEVDLVITGQETELDRTVIDEIGDPLVHVLRNSLDHGIELPEERVKNGKPPKGTINLIARHEGNNVVIEVDDDGKGIDANLLRRKIVEKNILKEEEAKLLDDSEAINYIFNAGFSTAEKITDVSGRGVGLDAVRSKIEALSGDIFIESKVNEGTKFIIQLPLTLAIIQALLVQISDEVYSIPLSFIAETTFITNEQIKLVQDQEVILLRGNMLPLIRLHEVYNVPEQPLNLEEISVVVVKKGEKKVGLIVDYLIGQQEIVIKSLGGVMENLPAVAGATILGNGLVSLIVDVTSLF